MSIRWHGANFVTLTYRGYRGSASQQVLGRDHDPGLWLAAKGPSHAFDGDADSWRPAAEALRIRCASLFDPMLARQE